MRESARERQRETDRERERDRERGRERGRERESESERADCLLIMYHFSACYREFVGALGHSLLCDGEVEVQHRRVRVQVRRATAVGVVVARIERHQGLVVPSVVHRTEQDLEFHSLRTTHYSDIRVPYRKQ